MQKFSVEVVLQAPGNEPVTMNWVKAGSAVNAIGAVAQILSQESEPGRYNPAVLSVTVKPVEEV